MAMSSYGANMGPMPNISPASTYGGYQPQAMGNPANMNISSAGFGPNTSLSPSMYAPNMSYAPQSKQGPMSIAALAAPYGIGGLGASTAYILVLFILLVIILRSCF